MKIAMVVALVLSIGAVLTVKGLRRDETSTPATGPEAAESADQRTAQDAARPRLLELGSVDCIPCKMMEPILAELRRDYGDRLQVDFIDVKKSPGAARAYGIRVIPTQIFFDASGEEVHRHEGYYPKEDILARWEELGVDLGGP
jgi:thioredoxin 1